LIEFPSSYNIVRYIYTIHRLQEIRYDMEMTEIARSGVNVLTAVEYIANLTYMRAVYICSRPYTRWHAAVILLWCTIIDAVEHVLDIYLDVQENVDAVYVCT
jgi:hypothetical protein